MLKSFLRLATEFQLRSFDAIVAHTAIVLARYTFLAVENREAKDGRTLGALFYFICDELRDISFADAFDLIISALSRFLGNHLLLANELVATLVTQFIDCLPVYIKGRLVF